MTTFPDSLWTGIDYLGEAHGWPIHGSGAGLLTLAGFEKASYFRRQSFWSETPVIHLTTALPENDHGEYTNVSESWNYPLGEKVLVKCYTNLKQAEFFLNGTSLGVYEKQADCDCISFHTPFVPGELLAVGITETLDVPAPRHCIYTTGTACQMNLQAWKPAVTPCDNPQKLHQIEVTMLDTDGHRVYNDSTLLHVTVENGTLLGLENGDLADVTEYTAHYRRALRGQLLIYVSAFHDAKSVTVRVTGEGTKAATLTLTL